MPRKPALLLSLLNLMLKPIARQTSIQSNQLLALPQHPPPHDHAAWRIYWQAQDQPWRTEPEIDVKRQEYLSVRRAISPNIQQGIYPFQQVKLNRADIEWLLSTHENGHGPVDWSDECQREREGIDLRGADIQHVNLSYLPLAGLRGGLTWNERNEATQDQRKKAQMQMVGANLFGTQLQGANLREAQLQEADLRQADLQKADLRRACLEKSDLRGAQLRQADLRGALLQEADLRQARLQEANMKGVRLEKTDLRNILFSDPWHSAPMCADVLWESIYLSGIQWSQVRMLGDEHEARKSKHKGKRKNKALRLSEYETAVRANRQLAIALQQQGLNEEASRFAYRAQCLQRRVFWLEIVQPRAKLKQKGQMCSAWLFSWFLYLIAGYGYQPSRSFLAYFLVIASFATAYYLLGYTVGPELSPLGALVFSMTSFHGRGFFPGTTVSLDDPLTVLAALEALVGLITEVTFIATLTQRFFNR
ncbi:hypothetical protein KSF_086710 [Reticulibacter mediterranei]|uniref:Pentapeptide repeat-containing protein n=1 Tax=Reticulibacter mediterranei TaxID=2778369 RepID=A0A8J3IU51_9CHLR|nr:pentapeptide repeat-containing protein [Reticulibacter mediterranei]GHO98623.1 hypothetical protein KSF_086710 [Reticulibacter mediterranei]